MPFQNAAHAQIGDADIDQEINGLCGRMTHHGHHAAASGARNEASGCSMLIHQAPGLEQVRTRSFHGGEIRQLGAQLPDAAILCLCNQAGRRIIVGKYHRWTAKGV